MLVKGHGQDGEESALDEVEGAEGEKDEGELVVDGRDGLLPKRVIFLVCLQAGVFPWQWLPLRHQIRLSIRCGCSACRHT